MTTELWLLFVFGVALALMVFGELWLSRRAAWLCAFVALSIYLALVIVLLTD